LRDGPLCGIAIVHHGGELSMPCGVVSTSALIQLFGQGMETCFSRHETTSHFRVFGDPTHKIVMSASNLTLLPLKALDQGVKRGLSGHKQVDVRLRVRNFLGEMVERFGKGCTKPLPADLTYPGLAECLGLVLLTPDSGQRIRGRFDFLTPRR
jgi:hypothetical protein